jgi:hypothetical protein
MSTRVIGLPGTASYLPERVVTNEGVAAMTPDATTEWILRKTAIAPATGLPKTRLPRISPPSPHRPPWSTRTCRSTASTT